MFLNACEIKGLSTKTIGSYEQALRLMMQHLDRAGIQRTEDVTHLVIQGYLKEIKTRGKYTVTIKDQSGNYPEHRTDYGNKVSEVTINNYLRNLRVFFNWCVEEDTWQTSQQKPQHENDRYECTDDAYSSFLYRKRLYHKTSSSSTGHMTRNPFDNNP